MNPEQFRAALDALGMTQMDCTRFLGVGERTVRRWAHGEEPRIPDHVAMLLRLMIARRIKPETVRRIFEEA